MLIYVTEAPGAVILELLLNLPRSHAAAVHGAAAHRDISHDSVHHCGPGLRAYIDPMHHPSLGPRADLDVDQIEAVYRRRADDRGPCAPQERHDHIQLDAFGGDHHDSRQVEH